MSQNKLTIYYCYLSACFSDHWFHCCDWPRIWQFEGLFPGPSGAGILWRNFFRTILALGRQYQIDIFVNLQIEEKSTRCANSCDFRFDRTNSDKALTNVKCAASIKRLWESWLYFLWSLCIRYLFYNNELILSLFHYKWINIASLSLLEGIIFLNGFPTRALYIFWLQNWIENTFANTIHTECSTTTYLQSNSHKLKILLFLPNIESTFLK